MQRQLIPEGLAEMAPGPELAALLDGMDIRTLAGNDLVDVLRARARQLSHEQARLLATMTSPPKTAAGRRHRIRPPDSPEEACAAMCGSATAPASAPAAAARPATPIGTTRSTRPAAGSRSTPTPGHCAVTTTGSNTKGGWRLHQTSPGHFTWISPLGRRYDTRPQPIDPDYAPPQPP
jgi:hypothetical protein